MIKKDINEAIKHLTPRSKEELKTIYSKLSPNDKLETGSKEGILWLVKDALAAGADVHANNDLALLWASGNGHVEVVKVLKDWIKKEKMNEGIKHLTPRSEEEIISAFAELNKAVVLTYAELGFLPIEKCELIAQVCDEILEGIFNDQFPLFV